MRREKSNYVIQSVSHALDVMEQFTAEHPELGVTDLSKRLRLHKNNVFRLLATLESRGYIEQNRTTENYRLGSRCLQLGQACIAQMAWLGRARVFLEQLAAEVGETAFAASLRSCSVVPLDSVEPPHAVRVVIRIGEPLPAFCTAPGKLELALMPPAAAEQALSNELARRGTPPPFELATLLRELDEIADLGFAMEAGGHIADVNAISAPVRDHTRAVVGTLTLAGPAHRLTADRLRSEARVALTRTALELSLHLGHTESPSVDRRVPAEVAVTEPESPL